MSESEKFLLRKYSNKWDLMSLNLLAVSSILIPVMISSLIGVLVVQALVWFNGKPFETLSSNERWLSVALGLCGFLVSYALTHERCTLIFEKTVVYLVSKAKQTQEELNKLWLEDTLREADKEYQMSFESAKELNDYLKNSNPGTKVHKFLSSRPEFIEILESQFGNLQQRKIQVIVGRCLDFYTLLENVIENKLKSSMYAVFETETYSGIESDTHVLVCVDLNGNRHYVTTNFLSAIEKQEFTASYSSKNME